MLVHDNDLVTINGFGDGSVSNLLNSSYIILNVCSYWKPLNQT
jgi:hypothetical protein